MSGVAVRLTGVRRAFDGNVIIAGMNLKVARGEFLAMLGPSGCGKSTLLRMIARLSEPCAGTIQFDPGEPSIGYVFQDAHLLPWRTTLDNAALPLELIGVDIAERRVRAGELLRKVGLEGAFAKYPAQLSGGMKMRVSLARALITNPNLLLLDEPFAALDEITRFQLEVQLRELWRERGMTVIFVTHSISEAAFLADRAVVLTRRGGGIKLDQWIDLPEERGNALRSDPRLGAEMRPLLSSMEEE